MCVFGCVYVCVFKCARAMCTRVHHCVYVCTRTIVPATAATRLTVPSSPLLPHPSRPRHSRYPALIVPSAAPSSLNPPSHSCYSTLTVVAVAGPTPPSPFPPQPILHAPSSSRLSRCSTPNVPLPLLQLFPPPPRHGSFPTLTFPATAATPPLLSPPQPLPHPYRPRPPLPPIPHRLHVVDPHPHPCSHVRFPTLTAPV